MGWKENSGLDGEWWEWKEPIHVLCFVNREVNRCLTIKLMQPRRSTNASQTLAACSDAQCLVA